MNSPKTYGQLNTELEGIIERLQSNSLDVDQIINEYQKGIKLAEEMETYLKTARNKISKINSKNKPSSK